MNRVLILSILAVIVPMLLIIVVLLIIVFILVLLSRSSCLTLLFLFLFLLLLLGDCFAGDIRGIYLKCLTFRMLLSLLLHLRALAHAFPTDELINHPLVPLELLVGFLLLSALLV